MAARTRLLGLDLGRSRIGVAVSDELGLLARGLPTLERGRRGEDLAALQKLARAHRAAGFVVGLPLRLSGEEGPQAGFARGFGAALAAATRLPVEFWDERLTSVEADALLHGPQSASARRRRPRGRVDQLAAVLILQSYLDHRAPPAEPPSSCQH